MTIHNKANGNQVLDVSNGANANGTIIQFYASNGSAWQQFNMAARNGTGQYATKTKRYGQRTYIPATAPTRSGYKFKNWNTKSDGTGTAYAPGQNFTSDIGGTVTLYASWQKLSYTNTIVHWKYVGTGGDNGDGTFKRMGSTTFTGTQGSTVTIPTSHIQSYSGYTNTGNVGSNWGTSTWSTKKIGATFIQPAANVSMEYYYYPDQVLDLNGWLDGASNGNISGYGTADVYINGTLAAKSITKVRR